MKFLVLAYGAEEDWSALSESQQQELLAQDKVLVERGDHIAAVHATVTTVRNHDRATPHVTTEPFAQSRVPLAGFGIIEAASIEEAIELVARTPCAVAGGAVEIRQLMKAVP